MADTATLIPIRNRIVTQRDRLSALIAPPSVSTLCQFALDEGFTTVDFFDGFDDPNTIDTQPNSPSMAPKPGAKWFLSWIAQASDFYTIDKSYLSINVDRSNDGGYTLQTVPPWFPDAGQSFRGSRWFEFRARWDASSGPDRFPNAGAVAWSFSVEHMRWQIENFRTGRNVPPLRVGELDFFESPKTGGIERILMSIAQWEYTPRPGAPAIADYVATFLLFTNPEKSWADDYIKAVIPGFDRREWHNYQTSYKTAADNNGVGYVKRFIDGIPLPAMTVTWRPGELFSILDDQARYLIIGTGLNYKAHYDHVLVGR